MTTNRTARVRLHVSDEGGSAIPFCVEWGRLGADGGGRAWSADGRSEVELEPGAWWFLLSRGVEYEAARFTVELRAGEEHAQSPVLRRRLRARARGWYCGESHMHVLHGRNDPPATIADAAVKAAAEGLDYIQLAPAWAPSFAWLPVAELQRQCREASGPGLAVGWNLEAPKAYMGEDHGGEQGNLHCYGHGWTVGLKEHSSGRDFFKSGPAFRVIQEVHRQGGIVGCAHPTRFWFKRGNFVSNWASELPFDFVAGAAYDAVDILNDSPLLFFQSERLWYTLLNLGYKVAGTGNSDGSAGSPACRPGRFRTYTLIDGPFSWAALAAGMRAGRNVATSGPFVEFSVDGHPPGAEFAADGKTRRATLKAWSAPLPGEVIDHVQLVRNGEVARAWDLRAEIAREWQTSFELREDEFSWYCVRVLSRSRDPAGMARWGPHACELAVANPVYFLPAGFTRPRPQPARVRLLVQDPAGAPLGAEVEICARGQRLDRLRLSAGENELPPMPATASLRVSAAGHRQQEVLLFTACPELHEYCRDLGTVWPSFFSPEPYRELRRRLRKIELRITLQPEG